DRAVIYHPTPQLTEDRQALGTRLHLQTDLLITALLNNARTQVFDMHVTHALTVAADHARNIDLRTCQVCRIRAKEDIARVRQFHDRIDLRLGLNLRAEMWVDTGQYAKLITGACRFVDGPGRLAQLFIRA